MQKTLLNEKDKLSDPEATESHVLQTWKLLKRNGVYFKKENAKKKSKKLELHDVTFKQTSFTGRNGEIVFRLRNRVHAHQRTRDN